MNDGLLNSGVLQTLQHLRRCGLRRLPRRPSESAAPAWLVQLDKVRSERGGPTEGLGQMRSVATAASGRMEHRASGGGTPAVQEPVVAPEDAAGATGQAIPQYWTLPVLSVDQRREKLEGLDAQVRACRLCEHIVHYRRQTVFGEGPLQPKVCFMGEAPGADEDRLGRPFVGRAGQLLDRIIAAMKLRREDVYILNALKCRPPQNRTPDPQEIENCRPWVETQLEVLQPEFIVCLGAVAVRSLLRSTSPIGRMRGRFHQYKGARVVVTYHPSYLLRNESAKRFVWEDMKMLMRELGIRP